VSRDEDSTERGRRWPRRRVAGVALSLVAVAAAASLAPGLISGHSLTIDPGSRTTSTPLPEPAADAWLHARWTVGPVAPRGTGNTLTWTGTEVLASGGLYVGAGLPYTDGYAAYNPRSRTWRALRPTLSGTLRGVAAPHVAVTGEVFTFGRPSPADDRYRLWSTLYDPASNILMPTSPDPLGELHSEVSSTIVGSRVQVTMAKKDRVRAAFYDPATNTWQRADPPEVKGHGSGYTAVVGTPAGALMWHMYPRYSKKGTKTGVDLWRWNNGWSRESWSSQKTVGIPRMAGDKVLLDREGPCVYCESYHGSYPPERGRLVDPVTLHVTTDPVGPLDGAGPRRIGLKNVEIDFSESLRQVQVLDRARGTWTALLQPPVAPAVQPVWTGHELVSLTKDGRVLVLTPGS
jgi:hypothetical protein